MQAGVEPRLEIGSEHDVRFTDLLANGQGVGRVGQRVVFVWGPLPGERARIRISEIKKSYAVGETLEMLEHSPDRTAPFCPVFGTCGGCQVQHLSYGAQLEWKTRLVRDALERIGGFAGVRVAPALGMDEPRAYRNKMALVVGASGEAIELGFYQMRSHDFVPIAGCPVVLPQLDEAIAALRRIANDSKVGPAFRTVKHAIARAGASTAQSVLALTTTEASPEIARIAGELAGALPGITGISNSFAPPSENAILGRKQRVLWGASEMEERIPLADGREARYRVSAASFFQINSAMVARVFIFLAGLTPARNVVDLYSGAGTFAIWFAMHGARVTGIEENRAATVEAQANAELNAVAKQTRFFSGRVESVLRTSAGRQALREADLAFLDPPRKGSDPQTLDALCAANLPAIWYLSCNPATLARDLARLRAGGYVLEDVTPFDFFPQTGHIEALARMRRPDASQRERR